MAIGRNIYRGHKKRKVWPFVLVGIIFLSLGYLGFKENYLNKNENLKNGTEKEKNMKDIIQKPITKKQTEGIIASIESYLNNQVGTYGYHVIELNDGRSFGKRDDSYYTAASTIKVAIFTYLYNQIEAGKINEGTILTYTNADYEGGTGTLLADPIGTKYKVSYLAERMIVVSDNVATNILIRKLGRTNIQNYLNNNGLSEIKFSTNDVTPRGMAKLLEKIYFNKLISKKNTDLLFGYMKKSITPTRLVSGVPKNVEVAHKIGSWSGAMSDIGIVFYKERPYIIVVYSDGVAWGEVTDAVIAEISKKIYDFERSF